jgi:tight adherence protein C
VAGVVGGVLGRDWWLTQQVQRREELLLAEFPVIAELLALAVTAGESPTAAIARVTRLSGGELARELGAALGRARAGVPLVDALQQVADRTSLDALARFIDGLLVAIERGTPLAEVLRAQAADVREAGKRRLLEAGGRKEIAMMVPVVFLVLPVTVVFALAARVRGEDPERGDVPGWVMITVMTAALVLAILIPFRAAIVDAVTNALDSVTSAG